MATLEFFYDFVSPYSYLASTRIEAEAAYTQKVVGSDLGYFFSNVVS